MSIFRAYDIRGIYPSEIDEEMARKIGAAFGTLLIKRGVSDVRVAVGRDARVHGPGMQSAFMDGLSSTGAAVYDIGMVPTPLSYFAVVKNNLSGGCSTTASHNPKEYNGFKICVQGAEPLGEQGIKELEQIAESGEFEKGKGSIQKLNVTDDYIREMSEKFRLERALKVVLDAGNGVAGITAVKIFQNIGCEVTQLYCEPDGNFPNHQPDPLEKPTLRNLQSRVTETGSDFGVAYDGDGDRTGFVDRNGNIIKNDDTFALFVLDAAKQTQNLRVVYDVSSSKVVEDVIKKSGGMPLVSRVGYTFIREKMKENGAFLGGEGSGHYYFGENHDYDDAVFSSLVFTRIANQGSLEQLLSQLPKYFTSEDTRIDCPDSIKFQVVEKIRQQLKSGGHIIMDIDGVKIIRESGWILIRASNTSPKIVLRWESGSEQEFREMGDFAMQQVNEAIRSMQ